LGIYAVDRGRAFGRAMTLEQVLEYALNTETRAEEGHDPPSNVAHKIGDCDDAACPLCRPGRSFWNQHHTPQRSNAPSMIAAHRPRQSIALWP